MPIDQCGEIAVTVSIGVAVFPEHGTTAEHVLAAADHALYAAKNAGRDTYRLAEMSPDVPRMNFGPTGTTTSGPQPPRQARGR